mgnify:FL=1
MPLYPPEYSVRGKSPYEGLYPSEAHPHDRSHFSNSEKFHVVDVHRTVFLQAHFHLSRPQPKHLAIVPHLDEGCFRYLLDPLE